MRAEDAEMVASLCAARAGLHVDPDKTYLLESRLGPVARREGFGSVDDMLSALRSRRDERLAWAVVESMAARESWFFREKDAIEAFRTDVLPGLARAKDGEPVRVWSAACGCGQEIYSLAMVVEDERGALPPGARVELFASDLSERALEKAQSGLYTQFEIQRGLPIRQLVRHFEKSDEMWALSPRIRQTVRWRRINLVSDQAAAARFDVIFCRHLLGQLTAQARPRVLQTLARALTPQGVLVLGQGETVQALGEAFQELPGRPGFYTRNPEFRIAA